MEEEAYEVKSGKLINSDFLDGLKVKQAIKTAIWKIESEGLGEGKTNYRFFECEWVNSIISSFCSSVAIVI